MNVVHLTASPFLGGPERQMLGLARALAADAAPSAAGTPARSPAAGAARPAAVRSRFLSFYERGLC
ncbi:MAG: hypothetical protein AB1689_26860, partial [Thermodesulfobacteriota bacterium]